MKTKTIIVSSLVLLILLIPVVIVSFAFGLAPQYDQSFYGGMAIKYDRLKSIEGQKVVIIGGSSVAFGINSQQMEEELGMPVVNFGLYANLGTKYMLDVAEKYINKGDIVIVAPEQSNQTLSLYFNPEAVWYSVDGHYEILKDIKAENYQDMARSFLTFASGKFTYWNEGNKPDPDGVYNVKSFNQFGDLVYTREYNIMNGGYDANTVISFKEDVIDQEFIDYLNEYYNRLTERGAKLFYSFCPMNKDAVYANSNDDEIQSYYEYLTNKLNFTIMGNINTRILDKEWFYDSNFHLNDAGQRLYTNQFTQDLKVEIGDYTSGDIENIEKPQLPEDGGVEIDGAQDLIDASKIFKLSGVELSAEDGKVQYVGKWSIDGLTEYGKTLSEITIPDTLADIAVDTIADNCFAGNTNLTKITWGKNITKAGSGIFSGCTNLKSIYITSQDETTFSFVPDHFAGIENCTIYVPQEKYADFLTDYFWSFVSEVCEIKPY